MLRCLSDLKLLYDQEAKIRNFLEGRHPFITDEELLIPFFVDLTP